MRQYSDSERSSALASFDNASSNDSGTRNFTSSEFFSMARPVSRRKKSGPTPGGKRGTGQEPQRRKENTRCGGETPFCGRGTSGGDLVGWTWRKRATQIRPVDVVAQILAAHTAPRCLLDLNARPDVRTARAPLPKADRLRAHTNRPGHRGLATANTDCSVNRVHGRNSTPVEFEKSTTVFAIASTGV